MELIIAATAIFTILSPFINAWINQVGWSPKTKSLVAWGTAIVLGTAFVLLTGGIGNIQQALVAIPAIFGYSQAIYTFFVKNIATKFEALTTKGSAVIAPAEEGTVTVATDTTIDAGTESEPVAAPVQVTTAPEVIITDTPAKG